MAPAAPCAVPEPAVPVVTVGRGAGQEDAAYEAAADSDRASQGPGRDRPRGCDSSSFHPDHTTRSIVYSQALRYNRICSNPSDRDKHLQDLYQAFLQLKYPPAEVKKQIDRARRVPRSHLLHDRPNKENNRTPLAITFSPRLKPLQRIIKDLQLILKDDPSLSQILGDRPVLAYGQPPKLKQILTSNHTPHNKNTNPGTYPCNKARCRLCPHIYSGDTIIWPNHISHTIRGSFTCTSTNVIYAIMCQQCPSAMYIGQTGQSLRKRINGHKSNVRNYNVQNPVGEHFNLWSLSYRPRSCNSSTKNLQKQTPTRDC
ncbi:uncharacterized protein LOC141976198 [Natator depressus]|uniref:uncharacterized protein LOC141976198 n=1 Tax=Natator depressus TaxID=27790 RepID=UPI003EB88397